VLKIKAAQAKAMTPIHCLVTEEAEDESDIRSCMQKDAAF